jgi:hypothetical protein
MSQAKMSLKINLAEDGHVTSKDKSQGFGLNA